MKTKNILSGMLEGLLCVAGIPPVKYLFTQVWDPSYYNLLSLSAGAVIGGIFSAICPREKITRLIVKKKKEEKVKKKKEEKQ